MTSPSSKEDPTLLQIRSKDDGIKSLKIKTDEHYFEKTLKSLRIDKDYYSKKYTKTNKKKS